MTYNYTQLNTLFDEICSYDDLVLLLTKLENTRTSLFQESYDYKKYIQENLPSSFSIAFINLLEGLHIKDVSAVDRLILELVKSLRNTKIIRFTSFFYPTKEFTKELKQWFMKNLEIDNDFVLDIRVNKDTDNIFSATYGGKNFSVTFKQFIYGENV